MKYKLILKSKENLYKKALQLAYLLKYSGETEEYSLYKKATGGYTSRGGWSSGGDEDDDEEDYSQYGSSSYSTEDASISPNDINPMDEDSVLTGLRNLARETVNPNLESKINNLANAYEEYTSLLYREVSDAEREVWIERLKELTATISRTVETISSLDYFENADKDNSDWEKNESYTAFELSAALRAVIESTKLLITRWLNDDAVSLQEISQDVLRGYQETVQDGAGIDGEVQEAKYLAEAVERRKEYKEKYAKMLRDARRQQGLHQKWNVVTKQLDSHRKWWNNIKNNPEKLAKYRKRRADAQRARRQYEERLRDVAVKLTNQDLTEEEKKALRDKFFAIQDAERAAKERTKSETEKLKDIKKTRREVDPVTGREIITTDWSSLDLAGLATHLGQKMASERTQVLDEVKKEFKQSPDYITLLKKLGEAESRGIGTIEGVMQELREKLQDLMTTSVSVQLFIDSVMASVEVRKFQKRLKNLPKLKLEEKAKGELPTSSITEADVNTAQEMLTDATRFEKELKKLDRANKNKGRKSFYLNNQVLILEKIVPHLQMITDKLKERSGMTGASVDLLQEIKEEEGRSVDILSDVPEEQIVEIVEKKAFLMRKRAFVSEMIGEPVPNYLSEDLGTDLKPNIKNIFDNMIEEEAGRILDAMVLAAGGMLEDI